MTTPHPSKGYRKTFLTSAVISMFDSNHPPPLPTKGYRKTILTPAVNSMFGSDHPPPPPNKDYRKKLTPAVTSMFCSDPPTPNAIFFCHPHLLPHYYLFCPPPPPPPMLSFQVHTSHLMYQTHKYSFFQFLQPRTQAFFSSFFQACRRTMRVPQCLP